MNFEKKYKPCWSDTKDSITLSPTIFATSFSNTTAQATYNYSLWFDTTNNINCPVTSLSFYFSTSNLSPVSSSIPDVAMVPGTTTFTVDFPTWLVDLSFANNTEKIFYLVAESSPVVQQKIQELRFHKLQKGCFTDTQDMVSLTPLSLNDKFNS